jgi:DNA polymerase V
MEIKDFGKIRKNKVKHKAEVSMQTGFPSPATHYMENTVDLSDVLIQNKEASFYVRIGGSAWENLNIYKNDVLIIDRSLNFSRGTTALVVKDGSFEVIKYPLAENKEELESIELWGVVTHIIHKV